MSGEGHRRSLWLSWSPCSGAESDETWGVGYFAVEPSVVDTVGAEVGDLSPVLVLLDSNHSADHVLRELAAYADLATVGSRCIVCDTVIDLLPSEMHEDRPWGPGDSPAMAVEEFLQANLGLQAEACIDERLALSVAPRGYLRRIAY